MPATYCSTGFGPTTEKSVATGWTGSSLRGRPTSRSSPSSRLSSGPRELCLLRRSAGGQEHQDLDLVDPPDGLARLAPPTSFAVRPAVRSSGARRAQLRCANTKDLEAGIAQAAGATSSGWIRRLHSRRLARAKSRPLWPFVAPPSRWQSTSEACRGDSRSVGASVACACDVPSIQATRRLGRVDPPLSALILSAIYIRAGPYLACPWAPGLRNQGIFE